MSHGDPTVSRQGQRVIEAPELRFARFYKVDRRTGCWLWRGAKNKDGYGYFTVDKKHWRAHIWAWEQKHGARPLNPRTGKPLHLDHFVCDTPSCVNPDHVRPATPRENLLRGRSKQAINARKTHCVNGHEFTPENTYSYLRNGNRSRACRECLRARGRVYAAKRRAQVKGT